MKRRILLIDGHSLAYRAFYALPLENFSTSSGQHTNAIYGFASMLLNLIRDEKPTHIAAAFDVSRKTFRTEAFPDYKANRAKTPDEFRSQITYINELLEAFQIKSYECEGFEADDILATIVAQEGSESEILICTGDRDAFQLVNENVTVLYPKKGVTDLARMNPGAVIEKYGLTPEQYPDFAALRGDPSDNLPSIPGVGEKTASKWIKEYGSLKELIAHVDEVPGKAGEALRESLNNVIRNRELTQLRKDVPIDISISQLEWHGIDGDRSAKLFEKLEIKALRDRTRALAGTPVEVVTSKSRSIRVEDLDSASLEMRLAKAKGSVTLIVTESEIIVGLDRETVIKSGRVEHELETEAKVITHRAKPIVRSGIIAKSLFDIELAAYLVNPGTRDLEIEELASRYLALNLPPKSEDLFASSINPELAAYLFDLEEILREELEKRELSKLFDELEMPTLHLLAEMERVGIGVNRIELEELRDFFSTEESEASSAAFKAAGQEFNVASPKQLQAILFE